MNSTVSLVESSEHKKGVYKALDGIKSQLQDKLHDISEIVIKINFVNTSPELATTPFEAVEAFVEYIRPFYKQKITIAEQASGGNTKKAFKHYEYAKLAKDDGNIELLDLADDEAINSELTYKNGSLSLPLSKRMVKAPLLISITRPKTHNAVVATLGIKNVLVGVIKGDLSVRQKIHKGKHIHEIMSNIADKSYPDMVLLDGTVGMEGNGPVGGSAIKSGWTLASMDALAADSLAAYLMGFEIDHIGYLNMLKEKDFGCLFPADDIQIEGDDPEDLRKVFKPHDTFESQKHWQI